MLAIKKRKTIWFHKHDISQYKRLFDDAQIERALRLSTGARSVNCNRCPTGFLCYKGEYCYPLPTTTKKPTTTTTVKTTPKKSKQP
uniref:Candidate secreted effector n=1 Tax=Meloidogyne incognita TaxID=6306 RepID=A0A914KPE1_MELIC